jgi:hypothetical protein
MKKFPFPEAVAATALVTIAIGVLMILAPGLKNEVSAAWAQGILTALGIGLAMYSANQQVKEARAHADELGQSEIKQRRQGVLAIAEAAFDHVDAIDRAANAGALGEFFEGHRRSDQLSHATAALRAVPLHELQSYNMVTGIFDLLGVLTHMEQTCASIESGRLLGLTPEELYFGIHADDQLHALHAVTFIRGGVLGWTTEEINRQNGTDTAEF